MAKHASGDVLRSAERMLRVLQWFTEERTSGTIGEIAKDLEVAPTTVRRLLSLLEKYRYVTRDPVEGTYCLGVAPSRLAMVAREGNPLLGAARDEMDALEQEFGELILLGVADEADVVHVEVRESTHTVRVHRAIGGRVRADEGGALGSVLIAWTPGILDGPGEGEGGGVDDELVDRLAQVRARGYALNEGAAFGEHVWAVAAPIRDADGVVVAGLCLAGPVSRAKPERTEKMIARTRVAAATVSARLGWVEG